MNKSPKVVKVDLLLQSSKKHKSPTKTYPSNQILLNSQDQEFSFSQQKSSFAPITKQISSHNKINKKLFNSSPKKSPHKAGKISTNYQGHKQLKSKEKKSPEYSLYRSNRESQRLFKNSVDKLKKTFFKGVRDNREATIKTLKEIGKNARYRAEHKQKNYSDIESPKRKKQRSIPVQFYGCNPNQTTSKYSPNISKSGVRSNNISVKTQASPEISQFGTYYNFEVGWKQQVSKGYIYEQSSPDRYPKSNIPSPDALYTNFDHYLPEQQPQPETKKVFSHRQQYSSSGVDSINQVQIDTVCQIYQMCEKYQENDKLSIKEMYKLLQQIQRLYFIKVIQQSQSDTSKKGIIFESDFNLLLKNFEQSLRIVFYRKQECDIYDTLYYLKDANNLDKVCSLFLGIKNILQF